MYFYDGKMMSKEKSTNFNLPSGAFLIVKKVSSQDSFSISAPESMTYHLSISLPGAAKPIGIAVPGELEKYGACKRLVLYLLHEVTENISEELESMIVETMAKTLRSFGGLARTNAAALTLEDYKDNLRPSAGPSCG